MRPEEARMAAAKRRFSEAAKATLAGSPDAAQLAAAALAEVALARTGLNASKAPETASAPVVSGGEA